MKFSKYLPLKYLEDQLHKDSRAKRKVGPAAFSFVSGQRGGRPSFEASIRLNLSFDSERRCSQSL